MRGGGYLRFTCMHTHTHEHTTEPLLSRTNSPLIFRIGVKKSRYFKEFEPPTIFTNCRSDGLHGCQKLRMINENPGILFKISCQNAAIVAGHSFWRVLGRRRSAASYQARHEPSSAARTFARVRRLRCAARCPIDEQTSAIRAENRVGVWCSINIRKSHDMNEILTTAHILTFWFDLES